MAWNTLFTSDIGLFSLFVIVFIVGMAVWFARFFSRKMREEEQTQARSRSNRLSDFLPV